MDRVLRHLSRRSSRTTSSDASREALAFYQRRVALFGLVGATLSSAFVLFNLVEGRDSPRPYLHEGAFAFHLAGAAIAALMWLLCRGGARSLRFVRSVETVASAPAAWRTRRWPGRSPRWSDRT